MHFTIRQHLKHSFRTPGISRLLLHFMRTSPLGWWLPMWVLACSPATQSTQTQLTHACYVWQRLWTESVCHAVSKPIPEIQGLRVLACEQSADSMVEVAVDLPALGASGNAVVAVMRLNSHQALETASLTQLTAIARRWRQAGVPVLGIEVDYDCATSKLDEYANWLRQEQPYVSHTNPDSTKNPIAAKSRWIWV